MSTLIVDILSCRLGEIDHESNRPYITTGGGDIHGNIRIETDLWETNALMYSYYLDTELFVIFGDGIDKRKHGYQTNAYLKEKPYNLMIDAIYDHFKRNLSPISVYKDYINSIQSDCREKIKEAKLKYPDLPSHLLNRKVRYGLIYTDHFDFSGVIKRLTIDVA